MDEREGAMDEREGAMAEVARAIRETLTSADVRDSRGYAANLVDTTNYIANAISGIGEPLRTLAGDPNREGGRSPIDDLANAHLQAAREIAAGLHDIAAAIRESGGLRKE
jgi:hypothetical protein